MSALSGLFRKKRRTPVVTTPSGTRPLVGSGWWIEWPLPSQPLSGELPSFEFPQTGSINSITHPAPPLTLGRRFLVRYRLDVIGDDSRLVPVQGTVPSVTLYLQRRGDDWSGRGALASYRFYGTTRTLVGGEYDLQAELSPGNWRNVYGQRDEAGFKGLIDDPWRIGLGFGDPNVGATAHGLRAVGTVRFTMLTYEI